MKVPSNSAVDHRFLPRGSKRMHVVVEKSVIRRWFDAIVNKDTSRLMAVPVSDEEQSRWNDIWDDERYDRYDRQLCHEANQEIEIPHIVKV